MSWICCRRKLHRQRAPTAPGWNFRARAPISHHSLRSRYSRPAQPCFASSTAARLPPTPNSRCWSATPAGHPLTLVSGVGAGKEQRIWTVQLEDLDRAEHFDHLTTAYIPPLPVHEDLHSIDGIQWIVQRLVGPYGCPWDREQTHLSLRPYLLEEAHETLEALDAGDDEALSEELGDLLLQILLHSELARQEGRFDFGTVTRHIAAKLIRRHPHVFGDLAVSGSEEVLRNWEAIKAAEHKARGKQRKGLLSGVPSSLPALALAQKLTERAAKVGFDWPEIDNVWEKLHEELDELRSAGPQERAGELGDILFVLANLARWMNVDAESALRETVAKFHRRFAYIEEQAEAQGRSLDEMTLAEMDALWDQAKEREDGR
ncbi:MAG: hypothetical protein KatS3mg057_0066 [Herpetosiphonaceae bacterium]|nr:MAG: hypothetical protein KatS3mg057_0066 [Herpetosiphonaceae bacterium]